MDYDKKVGEAAAAAELFGLPIKTWLVKTAKSKTIWFSTAVTVLGAAEALMPQLHGLMGDHAHGIVLTVIGISGAILRFATTSAISEK